MVQRDQIKLIDKGYSLFRKDDSRTTPAIKVKDSSQSDWHIHSKYESKAARDRAFEKLMQNEFNIEG